MYVRAEGPDSPEAAVRDCEADGQKKKVSYLSTCDLRVMDADLPRTWTTSYFALHHIIHRELVRGIKKITFERFENFKLVSGSR